MPFQLKKAMEKLLTLLPEEDREEFSEFFKLDSMPGFDQKIIDGYRLYPGFGADNEVEYAYDEWKVRETDVFIVSFPKTGTNWVAEIVRHIMYQDDELQDITQHLPFQFFLLEVGTRKKFEYFDKLKLDRRYVSSHLPASLLNMEKIKKANAKVIYCIRNPKDQIVSWRSFASKLPHGKREPWKTWLSSSWDSYFEEVLAGKFEMNTRLGEWYPEHILSYNQYRGDNTVHFLYFEDLKKDLLKEVKNIAKFLEIPLTDEKADDITKKNLFDSMSARADNLANDTMRHIRKANLRKGQVGSWKDHFTVRQSERVDALMKERLKGVDVKFIYEL